MHVFCFSLRVVFVLSTIVLVTDCCSSRIVLFKDRTLRVAEQGGVQQTVYINAEPPHQKLNSEHLPETIVDKNVEPSNVNGTTTQGLNITEKSLLDPGSSEPLTPEHASEFITDPTVRATQAGNPNYHVIDIYYTIMRDVMSFECSGQYLTEFCLNQGRCFRFPIGNHSFFSCECADGYVGERCESKSINDVFVPAARIHDAQTPKVLSARIVFSLPTLVTLSTIYLLIAALIVFRNPKKDSHCFELVLSPIRQCN